MARLGFLLPDLESRGFSFLDSRPCFVLKADKCNVDAMIIMQPTILIAKANETDIG
jgi:hypothetical protein